MLLFKSEKAFSVSAGIEEIVVLQDPVVLQRLAFRDLIAVRGKMAAVGIHKAESVYGRPFSLKVEKKLLKIGVFQPRRLQKQGGKEIDRSFTQIGFADVVVGPE
jgi:hypothetical protein